jgi:hypothetical protein
MGGLVVGWGGEGGRSEGREEGKRRGKGNVTQGMSLMAFAHELLALGHGGDSQGVYSGRTGTAGYTTIGA